MKTDREVRIRANSPDYEEINMLTTRIAMLKNPHLHREVYDIPRAEAQAAIEGYEQELQELLEFQRLPFNAVLEKKYSG